MSTNEECEHIKIYDEDSLQLYSRKKTKLIWRCSRCHVEGIDTDTVTFLYDSKTIKCRLKK